MVPFAVRFLSGLPFLPFEETIWVGYLAKLKGFFIRPIVREIGTLLRLALLAVVPRGGIVDAHQGFTFGLKRRPRRALRGSGCWSAFMLDVTGSAVRTSFTEMALCVQTLTKGVV